MGVDFAVWHAKHMGLGGWTLSPHHFFLPNDGTLYYGHGRRKKVENVELKDLVDYAQCQTYTTEQGYIIPDEDGTTVFVFDSAGHHLETFNVLTKAKIYCFEYDEVGGDKLLTKIVHGSIDPSVTNYTDIERSSNTVTITSPFNQVTTLTLDAEGYMESLQRPGDVSGGGYAFSYYGYQDDQEGLLAEFTDPNGNVHSFEYDDLGRLKEDTAPGFGGFTDPTQHMNRDQDDQFDGWAVGHETAGGRDRSYEVEWTNRRTREWTNTFGQGSDSLTIHSVMDNEDDPEIEEAMMKVTRPTGLEFESRPGSTGHGRLVSIVVVPWWTLTSGLPLPCSGKAGHSTR